MTEKLPRNVYFMHVQNIKNQKKIGNIEKIINILKKRELRNDK